MGRCEEETLLPPMRELSAKTVFCIQLFPQYSTIPLFQHSIGVKYVGIF
jgi:hypothetical protein